MKTTLPSPKVLAASIFTLILFLTEMRIPAGKRNVAKTMVSLTSVGILLMSSTVFTMLGSAASTNAQSSDGCKKLDISGISESGHNAQSVAANAIDMKSDTRWANIAVPSYLQVDLGQKTILCSIDISWYRGEFRSYNFVISVSDDGINFKDVVSGQSTGDTSSLERYNLANSQARYVRTSVYGNTENDGWASINEMSVNGRVCSVPQISRVTANGDDGNVPQNTLDSNLNTRWSNFGFPSWIRYDLGESQPICNVDVAWWRGNLRVNTFTISVSNDGTNFTPVFSGQSSGKTIGLERYDVQDTMGRYMRITVTGNDENSWSSISEVRINGGATMECKPPQISGVSASGSQEPNMPQNTLDSNLNTRWSNFGFQSWIRYDLGESQPICNVDVAWYRGNLRVNTFTISVSNDGTNFTPVFSGQSSGKTIGLERYDVQDTMGRYMIITVTGNDENSWSSISEVRINGGAETPSQEICGNGIDDDGDGQIDEGCTSQEICGNGIDDDGDGQIDEGCPPSNGDGQDPFGIKKIYPTKAGGEEWFMDMTDGQDPRSNPPSLRKNSDGSFKVTSTKVRYGTFTSSGYDSDEIETLDHGRIAEKGYMQSPNDWRDVEITGYVKVNEGDSDENFAWYARGGRHTGSGSPEGCEGAAYKADLGYDGRVRFAKEQWHVSYVFTDHKRAMSSIEGQWVGFKGIMYNIEENGETAVKMEIWLDKNNDGTWVKADENVDRGGWGGEGGECGGESDQILTWGGPIATFRWDGASDVDIKNFSVREIQAPSQ